MKVSQINVGDELAYISYVSRDGPAIPLAARRVVVLEKNADRPGMVTKGVRVRFESGLERVVGSRNLACPWFTYHTEKQIRDARAREEIAIRAERRAAQAARKQRATELLQARGLVEGYGRDFTSAQDAVVVKFPALFRLLAEENND